MDSVAKPERKLYPIIFQDDRPYLSNPLSQRENERQRQRKKAQAERLAAGEPKPANESKSQKKRRKLKEKKARWREQDKIRACRSSKGYKAYLKSKHWKNKRCQALSHHGRRCNICGAESGLQVHHLSYANLYNEAMEDLEVLCAGCHKSQHPEKARK